MKRVCLAAALALLCSGAHGAVTSSFNSITGILQISSNAADNIVVSVSGGLVKVNGANPGGSIVTPASVREFDVVGSGSANTINLSAVEPVAFSTLGRVTIDGGNGNDTIIGSQFGDVISNGGGDDTVDPQGGDDTIQWTYASDLLVADSTGDDTVSTQAGSAFDSYVTSTSGAIGQTQITDSLNNRFAFIPSGETIIISMGPGSDEFFAGASTPDTALLIVNGEGDNDRIDVQMGGATVNDLRGGAGDDDLLGGPGDDILSGGADDDLLVGSGGNDTINGDGGSDTISWTVGHGTDTIDGGAGSDTFTYNDNSNSTVIELVSTGTGALLTPGDLELSNIESAIVQGQGGNDFFGQYSLVGSGLATVVFDGGSGDDQIEFYGSLGSGPGDSYAIAAAPSGALSTTVAGATTEASNTEEVFYYGTSRDDTFTFASLDGLALISHVYVEALNGTDTIDMSAVSAASGIYGLLYGGAGSDTLLGGANGDTLRGGPGDDFLDGGPGTDTLEGDDTFAPAESGNDVITWNPGDGSDTADGGPGNDTLLVNGGNNAATAEAFVLRLDSATGRPMFERSSPAPFTIPMLAMERVTLNGQAGPDSFLLFNDLPATPSPLDIVFNGGAGNDTFSPESAPPGRILSATFDGGEDADTASGGRDFAGTYNGGPGADTLYTFGAGDTLNGEGGDDTFYIVHEINGGSATITGGPGTADNLVYSGESNANVPDNIAMAPGGSGFLVVNSGNLPGTFDIGTVESCEVVTQSGDDRVDASAMPPGVAFTLQGGQGSDTLIGSQGADTINGGSDQDTIEGGPGNDIISGDQHGDTITWRAGDGSDQVVGGDDYDRLLVEGTGAADDIQAGGSTLRGAAVLAQGNVGGSFAIVGSIESVEIDGRGGDDTLAGLVLDAASGVTNVSLFGGLGNDTIDASAASSPTVQFNLVGEEDADTLLGSPNRDFIEGGPGDDTITPGAGDDYADGEGGDDQFFWNEGDGDDDLFGGPGTNDSLAFDSANADVGDLDFTLSADDDGSGTLTRVARVAGPADVALRFNEIEAVSVQGTSGPDHLLVTDPTANGELASVEFLARGGTDTLEIFGTAGSDAVDSDGAAVRANGRIYAFTTALESLTFRCAEQDDDVTAATAPSTVQLFIAGPGSDSFHFDAADMAFTQSGSGTVVFSQAGRADVQAQGFEFLDEAIETDVWTIQ